MVSSTQQSSRVRLRRQKNAGKRRKRTMRLHGTPVFPVHPAGYDAAAADAKPATKD